MASDSGIASRNLTKPGYTVELRLENQWVVIVGAGRIALRKIPGLIAAGARIKLFDPVPKPDILRSQQLTYYQRDHQPTDLCSARLIFAATSDSQVNLRVAKEAATLNIPCCRVDCGAESDFTTPARFQRPPLVFSVSTCGESPAMASVLRDLLAEKIPTAWHTATELAVLIRRKLLTEELQIPYNQQVLLRLIDQGLLEYLEQSDVAGINLLLSKHFGADFSLKSLQFSLPEGTP